MEVTTTTAWLDRVRVIMAHAQAELDRIEEDVRRLTEPIGAGDQERILARIRAACDAAIVAILVLDGSAPDEGRGVRPCP